MRDIKAIKQKNKVTEGEFYKSNEPSLNFKGIFTCK